MTTHLHLVRRAATMYVILTSKTGRFHTEPVAGVTPVEAYDYLFYGKKTAHFVIAELADDARNVKVRVVEAPPSTTVNLVPTKFLEKFDTLDAARAELRQLATFGSMDLRLERV
ncbi:Ferredoxin [Cupriavidus sp. H19C3]